MKQVFIISSVLVALLFVPKESERIRTQTNASDTQIIQCDTVSRSLSEPREMTLESDKIESKATFISQEGINFIKQKEGFLEVATRLEGEKYLTIGFGHYGSDVKEGQTITREQAEQLLMADIQGTVEYVLKYCEYLELNQGQLDSLVSFTYNVGIGNLQKLTGYKTRTVEEIAEHITAYTKSESEVNRNGLKKRREEEKKMFEGI